MFVNFLLGASIWGLVGLFLFKVGMAGWEAYKESRNSNKRFIDSLKSIRKTKDMERLHIKSATDENGNTLIWIHADGHKFKITLSPSRKLVSCVGFHRDYDRQVLYFSYDRAKRTYLDKQFSTDILQNEKKDIKKINHFLDFIVSLDWDAYIVEEEEKDYSLVKGDLYNIPSFSETLRQNEEQSSLTTYLHKLKREVQISSIDIKDSFYEAIEQAILISDTIDTIPNKEIEHQFQSLVRKDIARVFYIYNSISPEQRKDYQKRTQENLEKMKVFLEDIIENDTESKSFEVEKTLRVMEEKYKS